MQNLFLNILIKHLNQNVFPSPTGNYIYLYYMIIYNSTFKPKCVSISKLHLLQDILIYIPFLKSLFIFEDKRAVACVALSPEWMGKVESDQLLSDCADTSTQKLMGTETCCAD